MNIETYINAACGLYDKGYIERSENIIYSIMKMDRQLELLYKSSVAYNINDDLFKIFENNRSLLKDFMFSVMDKFSYNFPVKFNSTVIKAPKDINPWNECNHLIFNIIKEIINTQYLSLLEKVRRNLLR